jgi:RNA polymerase sigma-70 factor (ECF subfamily)
MAEDLEMAIRSGAGADARRRLVEVARAEGDDLALDVLARHASAGSGLATELLIEHLDRSGVVRRFVRGVLLDETAVDDVCQDTLISVAAGIGSFSGESKVTTWLNRIARNRAVDHLRRQREASELSDDQAGPTERMSSLIASRLSVQALLDQLPDHYRETVTMRVVDGLPYAEIAALLDRSVGMADVPADPQGDSVECRAQEVIELAQGGFIAFGVAERERDGDHGGHEVRADLAVTAFGGQLRGCDCYARAERQYADRKRDLSR